MSQNSLSDIDDYVAGARGRFEDYLSKLVGVPTVSADPAHTKDIKRGAELAASFLEEAGLKATIVPTKGHPVVMGQYVADPSYQTLTLYNHIDVQPADPAEWQTDPFKLTIKGDRYVGRGATDDKGPALSALMAVRYAIANQLPLNFNILWELEEEIGSPNFETFLASQRKALAAIDSVLISDTIWISADQPAVPYGLRGILTFELSLRTAEQDVHSGLAGGLARNPIAELAQVISECFDAKTGKVKIPGFYDDVLAAKPAEIDSFVNSGFSTKKFMKAHKLYSMRLNDDRQAISRIMAEPSFEVHGIVGGYSGPGVKTVVPPAAIAKTSSRLVPNQDPDKIFALIKKFIQKSHPDVEVIKQDQMSPYLGEFSGPHADSAREAIKKAFGREPAFVREGGSIGSVISMNEQFKAPIVMLGLSLPEHGYHAPNEYFDWRQASGGIKMFVHYFADIATRT